MSLLRAAACCAFSEFVCTHASCVCLARLMRFSTHPLIWKSWSIVIAAGVLGAGYPLGLRAITAGGPMRWVGLCVAVTCMAASGALCGSRSSGFRSARPLQPGQESGYLETWASAPSY